MKNKIWITIFYCAFLAACNNSTHPVNKNDDTISVTKDTIQKNQSSNQKANETVTDSSFAGITANTDLNQLMLLFGKENITDEISYGPEGLDSFTVTKIYKNTSKEIVISWKKNQIHKKISFVEANKTNAPYTTEDGLKIGSTLQQLLAVNEKPIHFYGTGWDYGGYISSFNKGRLEKSNIRFQLEGIEDLDPKLYGDKELNTDMPLVKQNLNKLFVAKIFISFEK